MLFKSLAIAAAVGTAVAQRPSNMTICDYYTTALLTNNTAANQMTLLTLIVNTAVIGNYTKPNVGVSVAGILAPGEYNGTAVDLLPYFNGGLASSNRGGSSGQSVNFLDGGGAVPLNESMPANSMSSMQYALLTHLYEFFGTLLGCSQQGTADFPAYSGEASMYEVHKFMDISTAEFGYFVTQVANSAASFGVAKSDLAIVGNALGSAFGYKCSPETTIIPAQGAQLQAICIGDDCSTSPNATCSAYAAAVEPSTAVSSLVPSSTAPVTGTATPKSAQTTGTGSATSSTATPSSTKNAASILQINLAAVAGGLVALLL